MEQLYTQQEREEWVKWAEATAEEFEITVGDLSKMTDKELDRLTDFLHELTLK